MGTLFLCIAVTTHEGYPKPTTTGFPVAKNSVNEGDPAAESTAIAEKQSTWGKEFRYIGGARIKTKIHLVSPELMKRASRPTSYAPTSVFTIVLNKVDSLHWLEPNEHATDLARAELLGHGPVIFHGVGFPDIRTDRKPEQFFNAATVDPTQWNPLVTWRETKSNTTGSEPIADVRCMGLSAQAVARRADRYEPIIEKASERYKVSMDLVKAVVAQESCFNNNARSHVGAQGLMQLMPETASWLKVRNPRDPKDNLRGGVRYLASLIREFKSIELALAAYNAGPGNVRRYKGIPPFPETREYLQKVKANFRRYDAATRLAESSSS